MNKYFVSSIKSTFKLILLGLLLQQIVGCGQRGDLTLPKQSADTTNAKMAEKTKEEK